MFAGFKSGIPEFFAPSLELGTVAELVEKTVLSGESQVRSDPSRCFHFVPAHHRPRSTSSSRFMPSAHRSVARCRLGSTAAFLREFGRSLPFERVVYWHVSQSLREATDDGSVSQLR